MDFITGFPRIVRQHDSIMVVVDKLTKFVHFIPVKSKFSTSDVAQVSIKYVFKLHGVPNKIVFDKNKKFTYKFWKELFAGSGTELVLITTYHPQIDGHTERVNRILEDMLRMYVMHQ